MVHKTSRKNVTSTVLIFSSFLSFWWTSWVEKSQSSKKNCTNIEKEETHAHWKRARSALSRERKLELRQWCTTSRECSVRLDKGRKSESSQNEPSQKETLLYYPTNAKWYNTHDIHKLIHVSTLRCHPQGVITSKVSKRSFQYVTSYHNTHDMNKLRNCQNIGRLACTPLLN